MGPNVLSEVATTTHPRADGHRGGGHRTVDPQHGHPDLLGGRLRDTADGGAGAEHGDGAVGDSLRQDGPDVTGHGVGPIGPSPGQQVLVNEVGEFQALVVLVAQGVEHRDVQRRGVQQGEHGTEGPLLVPGCQKRSGFAASHSLAARSSWGSAAGASAG